MSPVVIKFQVIDLERLPASWRRVKDFLYNKAGPYGAFSGQNLHLPHTPPSAPTMFSVCFLPIEKSLSTNLIREVRKYRNKRK